LGSITIIPCYAVQFEVKKRWSGMLPSPRKNTSVEFGLYLPIKIDNQIYEYNFEFRGTKVKVDKMNKKKFF